MFSIQIEAVFEISNRSGLVLVGQTKGIARIGDYLVDDYDMEKQYKIIGLSSINFLDKAKNYTHNPAVIIEKKELKGTDFKGKTLEIKNQGGI